MDRKRVFVFWSGGLDSTALIWRLLKEGHHVTAGYVWLQNNCEKSKCEKRAIKAMLPFLRAYSFTFAPNVVAFHVGAHGSGLNWHFKQLPWWLCCAAGMTGYDEIALGFVMSDDNISYLADMHALIEAYRPFQDQHTPVTFPLTKVSKVELFREMPKELLRHIWSCERPTEKLKPCSECIPCEWHKLVVRRAGKSSQV